MGVWVFQETCLFLKVFQIILHDLDAWSGSVSTTTNQFPKHPPGIPHQLTSEMKSMQWMWEGNRQEGQGSPNGGNRLQVPDIFISLKQQEETNWQYIFSFSIQIWKEVSLKMLCCHDTWFHLKLTILKSWVNQCIFFLMEMFVLSYVNIPQTLSSSSAKWLRTYLTNLYVILRYCSPNLCKQNYLCGNLPFYRDSS